MNVLKAISEFLEGIGAILLAVAMAIILFIVLNIRIILLILFVFVLVKYFFICKNTTFKHFLFLVFYFVFILPFCIKIINVLFIAFTGHTLEALMLMLRMFIVN